MLAERWLTKKTHRLGERSVLAYRSALTHHVLASFGLRELAEITTREVRDWLEDRLAVYQNDNSVKAMQYAFSSVMMDAVIDGLATHNPVHGAGKRLYKATAGAHSPGAMTPEERFTFLLYARGDRRWAYDAFFLDSRTGLRLGELAALQRKHVQIGEMIVDGETRRVGSIFVQHQYHGAGRLSPPKHGKTRMVELSPDAIACAERLVDGCPDEQDWLFPSPQSNWPLHPANFEQAFVRVRDDAGLGKELTFHSLRHTYASICAARGVPAQWLQRQLGHADFRVTMNLYGAWLRAVQPDAAATADDDGRHPPLRLVRPRVGRKSGTAA